MLSWYCKPALVEDLQGDFHESFERNAKEKGLRRARLIYIIDVLKFFRPYTVRKPEFLNVLIHCIMIGSYIRTSGRNIVRNKLFSAINIVGLSISMSVALVFLLSKGFLWLLIIASAIGLPLTYIFFDRVFLPETGNAAPLGYFEMFAGAVAVMVLALLIVGQTMKVARANPAEVLRAE